jgi:hypothetical protein
MAGFASMPDQIAASVADVLYGWQNKVDYVSWSPSVVAQSIQQTNPGFSLQLLLLRTSTAIAVAGQGSF